MMMDASQCVHCGLCLSSCPTYGETGLEVESPRGRLVLLQEWMEKPEARDPETARWLDDCLDCRACEAVCPAHVPTGHLVEEWRASNPPKAANPRMVGLLSFFVGSPTGLAWFRRFGRWSQKPWGQWVKGLLERQLPDAVLHLEQGLPVLDSGPLSRHTIPSDAPGEDSVMLFVGCVMDAIYSDSNRHSADLLRLAGYPVTVPEQQRCCGALHLHSGNPEQARLWAKQNIRAYEESAASHVAVNAAGCGSTLKEYPDLFEGDPEWKARAERFSRAVGDVTVLLESRQLPELPSLPDTVTVHDACHHAHAQKITRAPRTLIERAGYRIQEMADSSRCCGSAGIYNLTHPEMSQALLDRKLAAIPEGVDTVAAANPGCILQIQSGAARAGKSSVHVQHPVDLAWTAYHKAGYFDRMGGSTHA